MMISIWDLGLTKMCNNYNLITRLCGCGENTLSTQHPDLITTIISDSNAWVVNDIVSVQGYTYKIIKVMTTGLIWTYELFVHNLRRNPNGIISMVISEDGLKREGNEPTRTFFWPKSFMLVDDEDS